VKKAARTGAQPVKKSPRKGSHAAREEISGIRKAGAGELGNLGVRGGGDEGLKIPSVQILKPSGVKGGQRVGVRTWGLKCPTGRSLRRRGSTFVTEKGKSKNLREQIPWRPE